MKGQMSDVSTKAYCYYTITKNGEFSQVILHFTAGFVQLQVYLSKFHFFPLFQPQMCYL